MAIKRKWMPSPCYHSRGGIKPYKVVLHTAEGATTIESLGNFFANGSNQVSSQTGADDKKDIIGEYVSRGNAAWTQANYNEEAVSMELCGFASWSRDNWLNNHGNMLHNAARWVAEECAHYGIPIVALNNSQASGSGRGVCQHVNLGSGGGNHSDCGSGFPMDKVIEWAKGGGGSSQPQPSQAEVDPEMFYLQFQDGKSPLVIPAPHTDGKSRIRLGSNAECDIRIDWSESSGRPNTDLHLGYGFEAVGTDIKDGNNYAVIRRMDESQGLVACTFSRA